MNLPKITELFNKGKLTILDAEWFAQRGYEVVCADGKVEGVRYTGELP